MTFIILSFSLAPIKLVIIPLFHKCCKDSIKFAKIKKDYPIKKSEHLNLGVKYGNGYWGIGISNIRRIIVSILEISTISNLYYRVLYCIRHFVDKHDILSYNVTLHPLTVSVPKSSYKPKLKKGSDWLNKDGVEDKWQQEQRDRM